MTRAYLRESLSRAGQGDSISQFAGPVNGFTKERAQLHEDIIGHYMSQFSAPKVAPRVLITGGLPGAGKSSSLPKGLEEFIHIDADEIKGLLPEYKNGAGAAFLHEESSYLAAVVQQKAMQARQDVLLDVTLKSIGDHAKGVHDNAAGNVKAFSKSGYSVYLRFTDISVDKAIERVMGRYIKTGRFVPPDYVRLARSKTGANSINRETFDTIKDWPEVTGWKLYTTENDKLEELGSKGKDL